MFAVQQNPLKHSAEKPRDEWVSTIIPYKNAPALISYYLGVFALIPLLGIFLGIPAFFLGLQGLKNTKEHPEAKGIVHAWIGVIAGFIFGFGYLALVIYLFIYHFNKR